MERLLYPKSEAREQLGGISAAALDRLVASGALRPTCIGRRVFFTRDELIRYVASATTAA